MCLRMGKKKHGFITLVSCCSLSQSGPRLEGQEEGGAHLMQKHVKQDAAAI